MTTLAVEIRILAEAGWRVVRDVRLRALHEEPHAFVSSYRDESAWDETRWRRTFDGATWVVAESGGTTIGMLRAAVDPDSPTVRQLEAVWVAPEHRQRGVLRQMLGFLAECSSDDVVTELRLWVLKNNRVAIDTYLQLGFTPTGQEQPLPGTPHRYEREFRAAVTPS